MEREENEQTGERSARLADGVDRVRSDDFPWIVDVWEASVRATHHFLSESDIRYFKPHVGDELKRMTDLACVRDARGLLVGFVGWVDGKIEALFVHPSWYKAGIGRRLVDYAMTAGGATKVDVNEQNEQAVGFYLHLGFEVEGRSELDGMGKPFPLLHLRMG